MIKVLSLNDRNEWAAALEKVESYDFYHTPDYHQLAEKNGEGKALCIIYEESNSIVLFPFLLRTLADVPKLITLKGNDITSVYGYAGPLSSLNPTDSLINNFQKELKLFLLQKDVICVFSRLHPLLSQTRLLWNLGETIKLSSTISIDLTLSIEEQRHQYRKSNKGEINKLRRNYTTIIAKSLDEIQYYIDIYNENMTRVEAGNYYFFSKEYFDALLKAENFSTFIMLAMDGNTPMAGAMFICTDEIVQYHLAGTSEHYLKQTPMKLILDEVRLWGTANGYKHLHLGGGVGSAEDNLFLFKTGFSNLRYDFKIWKWITNQPAYDEAVKLSGNESDPYFPLYREK